MHLDTLVLEPEEAKFSLVWRAVVPLASVEEATTMRVKLDVDRVPPRAWPW